MPRSCYNMRFGRYTRRAFSLDQDNCMQKSSSPTGRAPSQPNLGTLPLSPTARRLRNALWPLPVAHDEQLSRADLKDLETVYAESRSGIR